MPSALPWSYGGAVSFERGTPVEPKANPSGRQCLVTILGAIGIEQALEMKKANPN